MMEITSDPLTLQDFDYSRGLGEGAFGTVVLATYRQATADDAAGGGLVALKQQPKTTGCDREAQVEERSIMGELRGAPFCLQLMGSFQTASFVYLITEYCGAASLQDHIEAGTLFPGPAVVYLAAEMCDALGFMHSRDIVHRDVKPENIMFDSQGHSRLCDFGLAFRQSWGEKCSVHCGTAEFWAPELVAEYPWYDQMIDWWALGVSLLTLVTGSNPYDVALPFDAPNYFDVLEVRVHQYEVPKELGVSRLGQLEPVISDLIRDLLVKDPDQRLGSQVGAVREHPAFHNQLVSLTNDSWEELRRGLLPSPLTTPDVGHNLTQAQWRQDIKLCEDPALLDEVWDLDPYTGYESNFFHSRH